MEKLKDIKYLLFAYHHATTIIFIELKKTHNHLQTLCSCYYCLHCLQTFCDCYLSFVTHFNLLWLLSIVYNTFKPFVAIIYRLQHFQTLFDNKTFTFSGYYLPSATTLPTLQTSNLMCTSLLLPSSCIYYLVVQGISYSRYYHKK